MTKHPGKAGVGLEVADAGPARSSGAGLSCPGSQCAWAPVTTAHALEQIIPATLAIERKTSGSPVTPFGAPVGAGGCALLTADSSARIGDCPNLTV